MDGQIVPLGKEQIEQIKVYEFVKQCTDLPFIHIANERRTAPHKGLILKRMGVTKGVSDIFIPRATKNYHGTWIELKTDEGKPTPHQLDFIQQMIKEGYYGQICYGADEAILLIKSLYLSK